jgi:hypothetical protein
LALQMCRHSHNGLSLVIRLPGGSGHLQTRMREMHLQEKMAVLSSFFADELRQDPREQWMISARITGREKNSISSRPVIFANIVSKVNRSTREKAMSLPTPAEKSIRHGYAVSVLTEEKP